MADAVIPDIDLENKEQLENSAAQGGNGKKKKKTLLGRLTVDLTKPSVCFCREPTLQQTSSPLLTPQKNPHPLFTPSFYPR